MRRILVYAGLPAFFLFSVSGAAAQSGSGAFGSMSPGSLGQGGGQQSDFQKVREEMVQKMKDGTYAEIVRQGRENAQAFQHLRSEERR